MNELEKMVFESHSNRLQKSLDRIKELETAMNDFMYELDRHELRCGKGGYYYERFKKLLEEDGKRNDESV